MKHLITSIFFILPLSLLISCGGNNISDKKELTADTPKVVIETELLYNFIEKSGDIVNSLNAPFIIGAEDVAENLSKYQVIDIRNHNDYIAGHIDGALNVEANALPDFFDKKFNVTSFEKIVIACYSGQTASFYTSLLRLLGYGNVYSLKYGMSAWSKKITPNKWTAGISDKYTGMLEVAENQKGPSYDLPAVNTGNTSGYKILSARIRNVIDEGFGKALIKLDTLMQQSDKYYIINYWPKENYQIGHLKGAIQFEPKMSLKRDASLKNLPTDKPIVVYCYTGQHSAFVTAYLRVLGYDAYSLSFGSNGFMHSKMINQIGHAFNPVMDIKDYGLVMGELPSMKNQTATTTIQKDNTPAIILPPKKKKKEGNSSGGC